MTQSNEYQTAMMRLSTDLGLTPEPQDWGISMSDGKRVLEFITYFERRESALTRHEKMLLAELILASLDDFLRDNPHDSPVLGQCIQFVRKHRGEESFKFDYWSNLRACDDPSWFPISPWLRKVLSDNNG